MPSATPSERHTRHPDRREFELSEWAACHTRGSSYGFGGPHAVASDGTHVWVANSLGDSVSELDASSGALVRVLLASRFGFSMPDAVSSDGTDVWMADDGLGSTSGFATELDASTGTRVRVIKGRPYGFKRPSSVWSDGTHVWSPTTASRTR
jgi:DNA-binding beta-propeller fold protein YncE